jgi:predicted nucleotidyltransferase
MFKNMDTLKLFFDHPTMEYNIREVARKLKVSPVTASKNLSELAKASVLKERSERVLILYKANIESQLYRDMKIFYNIRKIRDSGIMEKMDRIYMKPAVILFGSAAYGNDTETSDFDIAIISEKNKAHDFSVFEKKMGRHVQIFAVKDLKELKNEHLINNILNGIVLQGELVWI